MRKLNPRAGVITVLELLGSGMVVCGAGMVYVPAGLVLAGVATLALAYTQDR